MYRLKPINIDTALRIYYENPEIGNKEIMELFGCAVSSATRLKKEPAKLMVEKNIPKFRENTVNTATAYEAWGIDIEDLEKRRNKLRKLNLTG